MSRRVRWPTRRILDRLPADRVLVVALLLALVVGGWIRLENLRWQVLGDDEVHALRTAVAQSYRHLLTDFSVSAAPPLPLLFKVFHDTVGLSEKLMRLPFLLAGLLSIVAFPLVLPRSLGPRTRATFAFLLAISPILVYYSRYARPYSVSLLLSVVSVFAFLRWWDAERPADASRWVGRVWAGSAALGAILAPWFHLTTISTVLAPYPFALADLIRRGRREGFRGVRPDLLRLVGLGAATASGLFVLLGAPLLLDWQALGDRAGTSEPTWQTMLHLLPLLAGSGRWTVIVAVGALATLGAVDLGRRAPRIGLYLAWLTLCTVATTWVSEALAIHVPIVFLRYALWLVPVVLLLAAIGIASLVRRLPRPAALAASAAVVAGLFVLGPLPADHFRVNSWTSHAIYQYSYSDESFFSYGPNVRPHRVSAFYQQLAEEPDGSLVLAEAPWFHPWPDNLYVRYQEVHGQWVKPAFLGAHCWEAHAFTMPEGADSLQLRNAVDLTYPQSLGHHGVDYLILHKEPREEFGPRLQDRRLVPYRKMRSPSRVESCLRRLERHFGEPTFEDRDLVVFDVRSLKTTSWVD